MVFLIFVYKTPALVEWIPHIKGLGGNNSTYSLLGRDVRKAIEEENY